ncbi:hypothetical protein GQ457_15G012820 [Hibiscus cannabinus]
MYSVLRISLSPTGCSTSLIRIHGSSIDIHGSVKGFLRDEFVQHFKCSLSQDLESYGGCCLKDNPKTSITQHLTIVV